MRKLMLVMFVLLALLAGGCDQENSTAKKERYTQEKNYEVLQSKQPAQGMDYSPTREGLNYWMETWDEPGKLSYVYLLAANGQELGYYVFEGLPVSYCASLTPTERPYDGYNNDFPMKAPSMDGVYYSGNQCLQYFGRDALTGSYMEFSIGSGINFLVYEQPLPNLDTRPLGPTTIEEARKSEGG